MRHDLRSTEKSGYIYYYVQMNWAQNNRPYLEMIQDVLQTTYHVPGGNISQHQKTPTSEINYHLVYTGSDTSGPAALRIILPLIAHYCPFKAPMAELALQFINYDFTTSATPYAVKAEFRQRMDYLLDEYSFEEIPTLNPALPEFELDEGFIGSDFDTDGSATMVENDDGTEAHSIHITATKFPYRPAMIRRKLGHGDVYPVMDNTTNPPTWRANRIRFTSKHSALRFFIQIRPYITRRLGEFEALLPYLLTNTRWTLDSFLKYARAATDDPDFDPTIAYPQVELNV